MLISQRSKEIIDNCRFCWMCRHICPIGNVTGQERNTARARMLALSLVERDAEPLSGVADNIYECALCGACTKECVTGFDPVRVVKEVRTELALNGETPDYIVKLVESIQTCGNIYGEKEICPELKKEIASLPKKADTVLFLGRDALYRCPEAAAKAILLLKKAGVSFTVLENEPDSGYAMDFLVGKTAETKEIAEKCAAALPFSEIICYDPSDAKIFLHEYKEWGIPLSAKVCTFTAFVSGLIESGKIKVRPQGKTYTVQDSAITARDLNETEPIRAILSACGKVNEMLCCGENTILAGNLILNEYMPKVMADVAKARLTNAKNMNAVILVTECPAEYVLLKSAVGEDIQLMTTEEVVLECLQA